jgi:hypothetical protein
VPAVICKWFWESLTEITKFDVWHHFSRLRQATVSVSAVDSGKPQWVSVHWLTLTDSGVWLNYSHDCFIIHSENQPRMPFHQLQDAHVPHRLWLVDKCAKIMKFLTARSSRSLPSHRNRRWSDLENNSVVQWLNERRRESESSKGVMMIVWIESSLTLQIWQPSHSVCVCLLTNLKKLWRPGLFQFVVIRGSHDIRLQFYMRLNSCQSLSDSRRGYYLRLLGCRGAPLNRYSAFRRQWQGRRLVSECLGPASAQYR